MYKAIVILLAVHTVSMVLLVVFMFSIAIQVEGIKIRTGQDLSGIESRLSEIKKSIDYLNDIEIKTDFPIDVQVR